MAMAVAAVRAAEAMAVEAAAMAAKVHSSRGKNIPIRHSRHTRECLACRRTWCCGIDSNTQRVVDAAQEAAVAEMAAVMAAVMVHPCSSRRMSSPERRSRGIVSLLH